MFLMAILLLVYAIPAEPPIWLWFIIFPLLILSAFLIAKSLRSNKYKMIKTDDW